MGRGHTVDDGGAGDQDGILEGFSRDPVRGGPVDESVAGAGVEVEGGGDPIRSLPV